MAITQLWQQRQAQQDAQRDFFQGAAWCRVRGADECQRDTIESLTRSVHGIFHRPRLNLPWRWAVNGKKTKCHRILTTRWCTGSHRGWVFGQNSVLAKQFRRNSSSVHGKLSTTSTAVCQDGFSASFSFDHTTTPANEQLFFSVAGNNKISPNFVNTFFWLDFRTRSVVPSASALGTLNFGFGGKFCENVFLIRKATVAPN